MSEIAMSGTGLRRFRQRAMHAHAGWILLRRQVLFPLSYEGGLVRK
jgi:hypothetical protein